MYPIFSRKWIKSQPYHPGIWVKGSAITKIKLISNPSSKQLADIAAKGADNKKAENIEIIDVRKFSSICNYFVICSADSPPQVAAITNGIDEILIKNKIKPSPWQGRKDSDWMIQDLISVVVHVMGQKEREKYDLEGIWGKSGIVYHV